MATAHSDASDPGARRDFRTATFEAAIQGASTGIVVTDATRPDHPIELCNPAFVALTGYDAKDVIGRNCRFLQGPLTDRSVVSELREALAAGDGFRREILNYRRDGSRFWNELVVTPVRDSLGDIIAHVGIQTDVTARRSAEDRARRAAGMLRDIADTIPGFIFQCVMDADGRENIPYVSQSLASLVGAAPDRKADGKLLFDRVHPDDRAGVEAAMRDTARTLSPVDIDYRLVTFSGDIRWIRAHARPVREEDGETVWNGVAMDITAQKSAASELRHIATHDLLTGLPNRAHFRHSLEDRIAAALGGSSLLAVVCADISDFSAINDVIGPERGDMILLEIAGRLKAFADRGIVSRVGGDRFGVALLHEASGAGVTERAHEIGRAISAPLIVGGERLTLRACSGIAVHRIGAGGPARSPTQIAHDLLKSADTALAEAKACGSGSVCLHSPELDNRTRSRVVLEQGLHQALAERRFELHFQPIVDLATGRLVAAEALVRWRHPTLGLVGPDQFIPMAETTGQIVPLGAWIIEQALSHLGEWTAAGLPTPRLAINISGMQLKDQGFFTHLTEAAAASGVALNLIELELTETAIVDCRPDMLSQLARLRALGVTISIDDFGTGYSSLRYLRDLPIDKIKIDRGFVRGMAANSSDAAIVRGIIAIARDLTLPVVVEGVETQAQCEFLRAQGCRIGQGYLFSRPLSAADFTRVIGEGMSLPSESPVHESAIG